MSTGIEQPGGEDLNIPAMHALFDTPSVLPQVGVSLGACCSASRC
ncbi:hypothetical protein [Streptomyces sp. NPDC001502]